MALDSTGLLAEITRVAQDARLANFDAQVHFSDTPRVSKTGRTTTVDAHLVPAGEGPEFSFTLAVTT